MYEVRCLVEDNKLRGVLVFLNNNNTLEPPVVIPTVLNNRDIDAPVVQQPKQPQQSTQKKAPPKPKRKKPIQQGGSHLKGKGSTQVVRDYIKGNGVTEITAGEMRKATVAVGYSTNAYSHAIKLLLADRTIRPAPGKPHGNYVVVKPTHTDAKLVN